MEIGQEFECVVCNKIFLRRIKGMKQRKYKISLRPYRSITCCKEHSREYLKRWDSFKLQLKHQEVKMSKEYYLTNKLFFTTEKDSEIFNKGFGVVMWEEGEKDSSMKEYIKFHDAEDLELFEMGLKLMERALQSNIEIAEQLEKEKD
jgi:hypothetical protein